MRVDGDGLQEIGDGLALDALEVDVSTFGLLLLPGHVEEGTLDVVVDDCKDEKIVSVSTSYVN